MNIHSSAKKLLPTSFNSLVFIEHVAGRLRSDHVIPYDEELVVLKTSSAKEIAPIDENFQFIRAASILRKMYLLHKPIGISRLSRLYQSKKRRGAKPNKSVPAARGILRKLVQRMEESGILEQSSVPGIRGRSISSKGHAFLDSCVKELIIASTESESRHD